MSDRAFSTIAEPTFANGDGPFGPLYWYRSENVRGSDVKVFRDPEELAAYASLHESAHLWIHADYDHDAWLVLDVDYATEVGTDFLMMRRRPGISLRNFFPALTDDPVEPPDRLALLHTTIDKLVTSAQTPEARFLSSLVANRLRSASSSVIYVEPDRRFYVEDLLPSREELHAWMTVER